MAPDRPVVRIWGEPEAQSLVFLHGLGLLGPNVTAEPAEAWASSGFRVIAPDLPGFGGSSAVAPEGYLPSALARELLHVLPDRFALVGFSWGGTIGCHMVAQAADRISALCLVDVGYQTPPADPASYEDQLARARDEDADMRFSSPEAFLEAARPHFSARISDEALLASMRDEDGELVPQLTPEVYAGAMHGVEIEPPRALHDALRDAGIPVLLLVAGRPPDERRASEVEGFAAAVPSAEILHFPDAGHSVLLDSPDEAIAAIGEWLSRSLRR